MAESVDALVSNTSGATRAGSTPALGTEEYNKRGSAVRQYLQHFFISPHLPIFPTFSPPMQISPALETADFPLAIFLSYHHTAVLH